MYKKHNFQTRSQGFTRTNSQKSLGGFTIIELMIATTVFSIVLLLCTFGLLQVSRVYYKGVTAAKVQEALRSVTDNITRIVQFSGGTVVPTPSTTTPGTPFVFCIDDQRYSVVTDRQLVETNPNQSLSQIRHVLVVDTFPGCNSSTAPQDLTQASINGQELLSPNMRLSKFEIKNLSANLYEVNIRIVYGDDDLLNSGHNSCANVRAGTQFCAVGELNSVVQKRI